jgi:hypothetical protein
MTHGRTITKLVLLTSLAVFICEICSIYAVAQSEKATVHCSSSCKVYVDENLVASLPQGGVKGIYLTSGNRQTILITRPGKPDWVHSVTPSGPLSLNPDEREPKVLETGGSGSDSGPRAGGGTNQPTTHSTSVIPAWLHGNWWYQLDGKKVSLKRGSYTCAYSANLSLELQEEEDHKFVLAFDQDLNIGATDAEIDQMSPAKMTACYADDVENASGQKWNFSYYINLERKSEGEVAFRADMTCLGGGDCLVPGAGGQITGAIERIDDSNIKITLKGPLPGEFTLQPLRK